MHSPSFNFMPVPPMQQDGNLGTGIDLTQNPEELFSHKNLEEQLHHHFYKNLMGMFTGGQSPKPIPGLQGNPGQGMPFRVPGMFGQGGSQQPRPVPPMFQGNPLMQGQQPGMGQPPIIQQLLSILQGGGNNVGRRAMSPQIQPVLQQLLQLLQAGGMGR